MGSLFERRAVHSTVDDLTCHRFKGVSPLHVKLTDTFRGITPESPARSATDHWAFRRTDVPR